MSHAQDQLQKIISDWSVYLQNEFKENILGVVQYGSTTKSVLKKETDVDLMLIFEMLPTRRKEIWDYLALAEKKLADELKKIDAHHIRASINPKKSESLNYYSPLFLDMIENKIIYFDPKKLIENKIQKTNDWVKKSGAYKVQKGQLWYWVLNPNYKAGDVAEYGG